MGNAARGNVGTSGITMSFGENECALNRGLCEEREIVRLPCGIGRVQGFGGGDVFGDNRCVRCDSVVAGVANARMRDKSFLHHRAEQAGEIGQVALQNF